MFRLCCSYFFLQFCKVHTFWSLLLCRIQNTIQINHSRLLIFSDFENLLFHFNVWIYGLFWELFTCNFGVFLSLEDVLQCLEMSENSSIRTPETSAFIICLLNLSMTSITRKKVGRKLLENVKFVTNIGKSDKTLAFFEQVKNTELFWI